MAKKRWSPSARTSDQAKAALADLAVVALERLSDPEVQAQIAAQGRAIADQAIAWRAERRRRARLDDDGDAASPAGSSRSGWLSESFGQGKLEGRVEALESSMAGLGRDRPELAESLASPITTLEQVSSALEVAGGLPLLKRKQAHRRIDEDLDQLEQLVFDVAMPKRS